MCDSVTLSVAAFVGSVLWLWVVDCTQKALWSIFWARGLWDASFFGIDLLTFSDNTALLICWCYSWGIRFDSCRIRSLSSSMSGFAARWWIKGCLLTGWETSERCVSKSFLILKGVSCFGETILLTTFIFFSVRLFEIFEGDYDSISGNIWVNSLSLLASSLISC